MNSYPIGEEMEVSGRRIDELANLKLRLGVYSDHLGHNSKKVKHQSLDLPRLALRPIPFRMISPLPRL